MNNNPSNTKNSDTFTLTMPSDTEVVVSRLFDASPEKLWNVMNDPALISKWWGPHATSTKVDKMDVRVGGKWRYLVSDERGVEAAFNGEYKEIKPPHKVVFTFEFEPIAGHISTQTVTLEKQGDKTLLTAHLAFANKMDRDGMVGAGMESGNRETWDRLEELSAK